MLAQDACTERVKGAKPLHALDRAADEGADALLHLACRLVGEGHGENLRGPGAARGQDVGEPRRQHAGLTGARTRQHQHRAVQC